MAKSVEDLTRPLSIEECRDYTYETLEVRGASTNTWKPGAVVRTIIYAFAILAAAFSRLQAAFARSFSLDLSEGRWLTIVAKQVYGVARLEGTFASGEILASNAGGGIYHLDPGDLIVRSTDGNEFRNTGSITIGAHDEDVPIAVRAVEAGVRGGAVANTITLMTTPLPGVSVTNPHALQGTDPETDAQLRARCLDHLSLLSANGPVGAYRYVARSARGEDGEPIGVTRVKTVADGYGGLDVYVATPSGFVSGDAEDPETDLGIVQRDIRERVEPPGVTASVKSATPKTINVDYELWIEKGRLTGAALEQHIAHALVAAMAEWPIGGIAMPGMPNGIPSSLIKLTIAQAVRANAAEAGADSGLLDLKVTLPTSDVPLSAHEAPALGGVNATIHEVGDDDEEAP